MNRLCAQARPVWPIFVFSLKWTNKCVRLIIMTDFKLRKALLFHAYILVVQTLKLHLTFLLFRKSKIKLQSLLLPLYSWRLFPSFFETLWGMPFTDINLIKYKRSMLFQFIFIAYPGNESGSLDIMKVHIHFVLIISLFCLHCGAIRKLY